VLVGVKRIVSQGGLVPASAPGKTRHHGNELDDVYWLGYVSLKSREQRAATILGAS
jgi:hypothetical protein